MSNHEQDNNYTSENYSKSNPIVEISSKQTPTNTHEVTPPVKPKEVKKTNE